MQNFTIKIKQPKTPFYSMNSYYLYYMGMMVVVLLSSTVHAQDNIPSTAKDRNYFLQLLTGGQYRQWQLVENISFLGTKSCNDGDEVYIFEKESSVLQVHRCKGVLGWMSSDHTFEIKENSEGVYLSLPQDNGETALNFYIQELPSTAKRCKEHSPCLRLTQYSTTSSTYSSAYYITR